MKDHLLNVFTIMILAILMSPVLIILPFILLFKLEQYTHTVFKEITHDM